MSNSPPQSSMNSIASLVSPRV